MKSSLEKRMLLDNAPDARRYEAKSSFSNGV